MTSVKCYAGDCINNKNLKCTKSTIEISSKSLDLPKCLSYRNKPGHQYQHKAINSPQVFTEQGNISIEYHR